MQTLVDAVRSTGASQPIIAAGLNSGSDLSGWLEYRPDDLLITVTDDGRPAAGAGGPGGRGLIGLRERIGLYGGELDAGPRPGGGWRVRARIPLEGLRASARLGAQGEGGEPAGPVRPEFLASPQ